MRYCFIAILKEGLSNISIHSQADKAWVTLREHPAMYQLIIRDNGIGTGSSCGGGIGLSNMQERVETLKGSIHFESTKGFRIFVTIQKKSRRIFMKVLIVDDDFFITTALKTILEADPEIQVCGSGKNGKEALSLYASLDPDILLMDIRMEEMAGLAASGEILSRYPQARILLLTTFLDDEYIIQALKLGAKGYLLKQDYNSIIPALKAVYSGQTVYGSEITAKLPGLLTNQKSYPWEDYHINPRELEVIDLVAQG